MGDAKRRGTLEERRAAPRGPASNHTKTSAEWSRLDFLARTVWHKGGRWKLDPNADPPIAASRRPKFIQTEGSVIRIRSKADLPDPNAHKRPQADGS